MKPTWLLAGLTFRVRNLVFVLDIGNRQFSLETTSLFFNLNGINIYSVGTFEKKLYSCSFFVLLVFLTISFLNNILRACVCNLNDIETNNEILHIIH